MPSLNTATNHDVWHTAKLVFAMLDRSTGQLINPVLATIFLLAARTNVFSILFQACTKAMIFFHVVNPRV